MGSNVLAVRNDLRFCEIAETRAPVEEQRRRRSAHGRAIGQSRARALASAAAAPTPYHRTAR